jgi:peptidoglycan/xylan/chitin deacetylase (PgdA/CDA1 family)
MTKVPILCYHHLARAPADARFPSLYVGPERFERQLWTLRRLGLRGVCMSEGLRQLERGSRGGRVILTFDDGYVETLTQAAPLLRKYGFTATCYIVSGRIGAHNDWDRGSRRREARSLMDFEQIHDWLEAGMEIGAHSRSHPRLADLAPAAAEREIVECRSELRMRFGTDVDHFCYPFGSFTATTVALVRRAGFASAVSTERGVARWPEHRYRLPRILVNGEQGLARFLLGILRP